MSVSQVFVRSKGYLPYDSSQISFTDEVKLINAEGWKLNLCYENNKNWSLCLPRFDTTHVAIKDNRYFLRTRFFRVLDCVNQVVTPIATYLYTNREKFGIIQSEEEIKSILTKDLFVARTLHPNVFMDSDTGKQIDLTTLKSSFKAKVYVKPVVYIKTKTEPGENQIYIDLEIVRATVFKNKEIQTEQSKRKVYQPKTAKKVVTSNVTV